MSMYCVMLDRRDDLFYNIPALIKGKSNYYVYFNGNIYSNVGRLFCTPAPPKFTKKLAVDSFFNFGS